MIKVSRALVLFAVLLSLVFLWAGAVAFAYTFALSGNPADTTAETTVTSTGSNNKANYFDANLNPYTQITGANNFSGTLTAEYGLVYRGDNTSGNQFSTRGVPKTFQIIAENNGNWPMTFTLTYESYPSPEAKGWLFDVYNMPSGTPLASNTEFMVPDDSWVSWEVRITPSTEVGDSPDTSMGHFIWTLKMKEAYPTPGSNIWGGTYTSYRGVNGLYYGGLTVDIPGIEDSVTIKSPVITITREAVVDSPDYYVNGTKHDPVPGSLYTVLMTVSNEGSGTAQNIVLIDNVPANMVAYKYNVQEPEENVDVTLGVGGNTTGVDWYIYYTTSSEVELDRSYGGAGWLMMPVEGPGPEGDNELPIPSAATFIKWQSAGPIPGGKYNALQWSCYIK